MTEKNNIYLGWDIGGASTKLAISKNNSSQIKIFPCQLWQSNELAKKIIKEVNKKYHKKFNIFNGITMSGEMSDIFNSRSNGVKSILSLFNNIKNKNYVFSSKKPFLYKVENAPIYSSIASMNWLVTAKFLETKVHNAIAIDIGSTTTDLLIFKNGKCVNKYFNDFDRLHSNELIYTGVLRTPIHSVIDQIIINKKIFTIIPENFANMSDVYTILSVINIKNNYTFACDNRSKTHLNSLKRLARVFGLDYIKDFKKDLYQLSEKIYFNHRLMLEKKIIKVIKKNFKKGDNIDVIGLGVGRVLIKEICCKNNFIYKDFNIFCKNSKNKVFSPSDVAPSYSLSQLLMSINEKN